MLKLLAQVLLLKCYSFVLINVVLNVGHHQGWIDKIYLYGWFQWYFRYWLGRGLKDDERQIKRWKRIVSRFRGKLVNMMKDAGYSVSPKV